MPDGLNRAQQLSGQANVRRFGLWNSLGANLTLLGQVLPLLALNAGAGDLAQGLIYAAFHLSTLAAVAALPLAAGRDLVRVVAASWWARAVLGASLCVLPWIDDANFKIGLIVVVTYLFFSLRALGQVCFNPVLRAVARDREMTGVVSDIMVRWHAGTLAVNLVAAGALAWGGARWGSELVLVALLALGTVFNALASAELGRMPSCGAGPAVDLRGAVRTAMGAMTDMHQREVVLAVLLTAGLGVAGSFQLNVLKGPLRMPDAAIFALTMVGLASAIVATRFLTVAVGAVPIRLLLLAAHLVLAVCGLIWLLLPQVTPALQPWLGAGLYLVATTMAAISVSIVASMVIDRLPARDGLALNLIYTTAGAPGALLALGALHLLGRAIDPVWYAHAFIVWILFAFGVVALSLVMQGSGVVDLWRGLAALMPGSLAVARHRQRWLATSGGRTPGELRTLQEHLTSDTAVSRAWLASALSSPDLRERAVALASAGELGLTHLAPQVLAEAEDRTSPLRCEAVQALGFLPAPGVDGRLRTLLDDPDPRVAALALKSLCRLAPADVGDAELVRHHRATTHPRDAFEIALGAVLARRHEALRALVSDCIRTQPQRLRELLTLAAEVAGMAGEVRLIWDMPPDQAWSSMRSEEVLAGLPDPGDPAWWPAVRQRLRLDGDLAPVPVAEAAAALLVLSEPTGR